MEAMWGSGKELLWSSSLSYLNHKVRTEVFLLWLLQKQLLCSFKTFKAIFLRVKFLGKACKVYLYLLILIIIPMSNLFTPYEWWGGCPFLTGLDTHVCFPNWSYLWYLLYLNVEQVSSYDILEDLKMSIFFDLINLLRISPRDRILDWGIAQYAWDPKFYLQYIKYIYS